MIDTGQVLEDLLLVLQVLRDETKSMPVRTFASQTLRRAKQVGRDYAMGVTPKMPDPEPEPERTPEERAEFEARRAKAIARHRESMAFYRKENE